MSFWRIASSLGGMYSATISVTCKEECTLTLFARQLEAIVRDVSGFVDDAGILFH